MRAAVLAGVVVAALVLTSCSDSDPEPEPTPDEIAGVGWSPCDGLSAERVSEIAGEAVEKQTGSTDAPRCTFTPTTEGGAAYDINYLLFDGTLDEALSSMGSASQRLRPVQVPGADSARIAVRERDSGILVSGFVETGGLVQSVNAVDVKPYDRRALVDSTTALLAELVTQAPGD